MPAKPVFLKAPLVPNRFAPLPLTAVRPRGWLREQLALSVDGISGRLHEFWPDVGETCAWLGGTGDDWERAPYYLDGLVPLAFLTDDSRLLSEVRRRIEWLLQSQREDGFFGPVGNSDWWPRSVVCKAMMQYYSATADTRILLFLLRAFRYQLEVMDKRPLSAWASARVGETLEVALWLYGLTEKEFLLELCQRMLETGLDWTAFCHTMPLRTPMQKHIPWNTLRRGMEDEERDINRYYTKEHHLYHVVNVAMGLKTPALQHVLSGGIKHAEAFDVGFDRLMKHHGVAYGMFTGDELLSGNSPTQGTGLNAVVELMHTLETMLVVSGKPEYGDMLEMLAFNALPAALSPDFKAHQHVQQANQVLVDEHARGWYNSGNDSNIYGLTPGSGSCTANLHQGYPKFVANLWAATKEGGLCAMSYAPCQVRYRIGEAPIRIDVESNYPFSGQVRIAITMREPATFPLTLRIPGWADGAVVSLGGQQEFCSPGTYHTLSRTWHDGDVIELSLPMSVHLSRWYHQSISVELGPLLFALQPEESWQQLRARDFSGDWAVLPESEWNVALCPERGFTVEEYPDKVAPFKHGRAITIEAHVAPLPDWKMKNGSADAPPIKPVVDAASIYKVRLVPYGDTSLRISQFPEGKES